MFRAFEIPPTFLAGSLQGLIAQRLMRRLCRHCRASYEPDIAEREYLRLDAAGAAAAPPLYRPVGCEVCFGTGYSGRTGIFEIMAINAALREALVKQQPQSVIKQIAAEHGTRSLEESARSRVLQGVTSLAEFHRVFTTLPD
jgi:general secretion pathway protein E/type IV pilus assembly protein PilB